MPDVGVLQLTIEDNSKKAGGGLDKLADALGRVKQATENGLGLSRVSSEIVNVAKKINEAKGTSTVIKNLATLFNSIEKFSKVKSFNIDTKQFEKLKTAVNGIKVGTAGTQLNAIRNAVAGDWGNGQGITYMQNLHSVVQSFFSGGDNQIVKDFAGSINQYTESIKRMNEASKAAGDWRMNMAQNIGATTRHRMMELNLQQFGRKRKQVEGQTEMDIDKLFAPAVDGLEKIETEIHKCSEAAEEFHVKLVETQDKIESIRVDNFSDKTVGGFAEMKKQIDGLFGDGSSFGGQIGSFKSQIDHLFDGPAAMNMKEYLDLLKEMQAYSTTPAGRGSWADIASDVEGANNAAQAFYHTMERTNEIIRNTAWESERTLHAFIEMFNAMSDFRSSRALGSGNMGFLGNGETSTEKGWSYYNPWGDTSETGWTMWKDGAIEAEGSVTEAVDSINARLEGTQLLLTGIVGLNTSLQATEATLDSVSELTRRVLDGWQGVSSDNALSTFFNKGKQWTPNWEQVKPEDYYTPNDMLPSTLFRDYWKPDWTFGNNEASIDRNNAINAAWTIRDEMGNVVSASEEAREAVQEVFNTSEYNPHIEFAKAWNNSTNEAKKSVEGARQEIEYVENLISNASNIDLLNMKIETLRDKLLEGVESGKLSGQQIADIVMQIRKLNDELEEASKKTGAFQMIGDGIKKMFPTLTGLVKRFGQIAKYRMLRAVMKHITSGFTEGVQNVYQYSKLVGTSLAPAMDSAATSFQQLKNSIGAAAAPLIQTFIPVIKEIVNVVIEAINYLNQFFALMRGQATWTRALPETAEAFESTKKSASGAGKAVKDLLADWDELNIIQSNSGGGSGGGNKKTAEEYKNMFEEVDKYDDAIKDIVNFVDEHLGGIANVLKKAGIILLGWKFSKAFSGLLGTIGKIVAGGALVSIGLELGYGSGFEAGKQGYFDGKTILGLIGGAIATGLGGYLIGGTTGMVIGLTAYAAVSIVGIINGNREALDAAKWGDIEWTREQIEEHVKKQFTFPVNAEIEVMKAHISDEQKAKKAVDDTVKAFTDSLAEAEAVVANVDISGEQEKINAIKAAATNAKEAIEAVKRLIETNEEGLTYTLTNFKFTNESGEDITADLLASISVSNTTLRDYFTGIGNELARLMLEGEKSGWKNGEAEAALALMESQKRIYDNAEELQRRMKFETTVSAGLKNVVSKETAVQIWEQQRQQLEEYTETVKESVTQEADNLLYLAALAESASQEVFANGGDGSALHTAAEEYKAAAEKIIGDIQGAVDDKLKETKQKMAKEWLETLKVVYGEDFVEIAKKSITGDLFEVSIEEMLSNPFGNEYKLSGGAVDVHGIDETANALRELLITHLTSAFSDYGWISDFVINDLGGDIINLFTKDALDQISQMLVSEVGDEQIAFELFKKVFNLSDEKAKELFNPKAIEKIIEDTKDDWKEALETGGTYTDFESGVVFDFSEFAKNQVTVPAEVVPEIEKPDVMEEKIIEALNNNIDIPETEPVECPVAVEPEIVNLDNLKSEIEQAMSDGIMTADESLDMMIKYGWGEYDRAMEELGYHLDEEGRNIVDGNLGEAKEVVNINQGGRELMQTILDSIIGGIDPNDIDEKVAWGRLHMATEGYSWADYKEVEGVLNDLLNDFYEMSEKGFVDSEALIRKYSQYGTGAAPSMEGMNVNQEDVSAGVERGATRANTGVIEAINMLARIVQQTGNRPIQVNLTPTSRMGRLNELSQSAYDRVTG